MKLRIRDLGPHEDTTIELDGDVVEVDGPSECGKSTAMDAFCFVLHGTDRHGKPLGTRHIRDGADAAVVTLTLDGDGGAVLERSLRVTDSGTRVVGRSCDGIKITTEADWAKWLSGFSLFGGDALALRMVMVPGAWKVLEAGEGEGRPLRNLLAGLMPAGDLRGTIAALMAEGGHVLAPDDPIKVDGAKGLRKLARRERDAAQGSVDAHTEVLEAADELTPVVVDPAESQVVVDLAGEWATYATALIAYDETMDRHGLAVQAHDAWGERIEQLGARPAPLDKQCVAGLDAAVVDATGKIKNVGDALDEFRGELSRAEHEAARAENGSLWGDSMLLDHKVRKASEDLETWEAADDNCSECGREWAGAIKNREEQTLAHRTVLELATTERDDASTAKAAERAALRKTSAASIKATSKRITKTEATLAKATTEHVRAVAARAKLGEDLASRWDADRALVGDEPSTWDAPTPPTVPTSDRPEPEAVGAALEVVNGAIAAEGAAAQHAETVKQARAGLAGAEELLAGSTAEHTRLEALMAAVRTAPTTMAKAGASVFGNLGPVDIVWGETGGCTINIDDRPWQCASDGRFVVADAWFREGLRRAQGNWRCPIFIDRAQDVQGMDLHTPDGSVVLRTIDSAGLAWHVVGE